MLPSTHNRHLEHMLPVPLLSICEREVAIGHTTPTTVTSHRPSKNPGPHQPASPSLTMKHSYAPVTSVHSWTLPDKQDWDTLDSKQSSKSLQRGNAVAVA